MRDTTKKRLRVLYMTRPMLRNVPVSQRLSGGEGGRSPSCYLAGGVWAQCNPHATARHSRLAARFSPAGQGVFEPVLIANNSAIAPGIWLVPASYRCQVRLSTWTSAAACIGDSPAAMRAALRSSGVVFIRWSRYWWRFAGMGVLTGVARLNSMGVLLPLARLSRLGVLERMAR